MKRTQKTQLQIEHVAPHTLLPHPRNPRTISSAQMAALERSITQFGLVDPVVVRKADRTVIGGHQRLEAARKLGLKTVPAVFVDLSQEQASLLNIALNKIAGDWDLDRLGEILSELRDLPDVDVTLTGFDSQELEDLFAGMEAEGDLPGDGEHLDADLLSRLAHPTSSGRVQPGQLWLLGRHRLMCGDSLEPGVLHRLCLGRKVPLTVTDPPYGIDFTSQSKARKAAIANDSAEGFTSFLERALPAVKSVMSSGATLYWFAAGGGPNTALAQALLAVSSHFTLQNCLVWDKETPGLGWRWRRSWEAIIEASVGPPSRWQGGTHRRNVLRWPKLIPDEEDHPTPKPVELLADLMRASSRAGEAVLDPFAGSGSTLIAAHLTGRACYACELEPGYCELILDRWEQMTGEQATAQEGSDA
jgi:DNA modification methylase